MIEKSIGEVCEVIAGQSPESKFYNKEKIGLPFYQGKKEFTDKYIGKATTWTTKVTKEAFKDDILMSVRAPVGPVNFSTENICIGRGLAAIRVKENLDKEYLFYFLIYYENQIIGNKGAVFNSINKNQIENLKIPLPKNIEEQKQIVEILNKAFESIEQAKANIEKNIENTKELFKSRLNEIFSQKDDGWEEKELIEINKFIDYRGKTPKKTESGIRLITAKNVKMGVLNREPEEYIDTNDYEDWMTRGIPQKGDVLFTTEAPLAMVALLDTDEKIALAQRIITLCPNREILSGEYLSYCMQSNIVQNRILEKGTGATVTGIKSKLLKEILIPIPKDKNTQKLIVDEIDILKEQTKQLEKHYKQKLKNLEELKKSILQKAFSGELLK